MLASELFKMIEIHVPKELTLKTDIVGFIGPGNPEMIEVKKVLVVLDYLHGLEKGEFDLVISHHPPIITPEIPTYVLHSNWDIVKGGANDALANSIKMEVMDIFDKKTGIGRICSTETTLKDIIITISDQLKSDHLKIVKGDGEVIKHVAIVSGFGLNPEYIELAKKKGMDLFLSGDLTHKGALLAKNLGITVIDATHQATEIPGLIRLSQFISKFGLIVEFEYPNIPWEIYPK